MYEKKYGNCNIPILKRNEYTHWRVKMMHHLETTYPDYLDMINDGPYVPSKLVPQVTLDEKVIEEHFIEKPKSEWSKDDKENSFKDVKVRNILFNSLDTVLTNYVFSCKTSKEMWDKLRVHCEGMKHVKKNLISLLIQQYEYFEANTGETLIETYDMFTQLLNEMAICMVRAMIINM